jgi:hypothetical protein
MKKRASKPKQRSRNSLSQNTTLKELLIKGVRPSSIVIDHERKTIYAFTNDMLVNQLRRDCPKIEASFDKLFDSDLQEISIPLSQSLSIIFLGLKNFRREEFPVIVACGELLINASNSFASATALLRMGYVLQPGILIRSVLEAIATVYHLLQYPDDFKLFEKDELRSTKTIAAAKKVLPPFGQIYGYFSNNFVHISHLHQFINTVSVYTERNEAVNANISHLRMAAWLLYVTAEILFNEIVERPRYWKPVPPGYSYDPSDEEKAWMDRFFHGSSAT